MLKPCVLLKMTNGYHAQLVSSDKAKKPKIQVSPVIKKKASHTRISMKWLDCPVLLLDLLLESSQRKTEVVTNMMRLRMRERRSGTRNRSMKEEVVNPTAAHTAIICNTILN